MVSTRYLGHEQVAFPKGVDEIAGPPLRLCPELSGRIAKNEPSVNGHVENGAEEQHEFAKE
jgi:hypothetical protein